MATSARFKKAINAYVKNDAKAAAIASFILDKDCSEETIFNLDGFIDSAVSLLPLLSTESSSINENVFKFFAQATSGKTLFIICGSSASGKDTLASYARQSLYMEGLEFAYTRKYTTRSRRGFEGLNESGSRAEPSGNYEYFNGNNSINNAPDAVLNYSLYGHDYALSGSHLNSENQADKHQMCIYGKLENIHEVKKRVFLEHKRMPFTILVDTSKDDCEGRIIRRHSMPDNEQLARIREIKRQSVFLSANETFKETAFDIVLDNSDSTTVSANAKMLSEFISTHISWANQVSKMPANF